ncbi:MAG: 4-hydroxybenzoate octaprenyltransferase [Granulosicoccus sp.]
MNSIIPEHKLPAFVSLTRLDRPIGIYLLMWPMLWAFWFAADGVPHLPTLMIFLVGTVLTRSAGCAINDYADRDFDAHVARTSNRPLATGALTDRDALLATAVLMMLAFFVVLFTNSLTIKLSFAALALAMLYPFTKRYTHFPQVALGAAFAWAVPMAFAAQTNSVPGVAWWLFAAAVIWAMAYDTLYAMADREDDLKIGIKSTAILFGRFDLLIVGLLQAAVLTILLVIGIQQSRGGIYLAGLLCAAGFVIFQLWICRHREPAQCLRAFLNNNWMGMSVFVALVIDYIINP